MSRNAEHDNLIYAHTIRLAQTVTDELNARKPTDRVAEASALLYARVVNSLNSIFLLQRVALHAWEHDGMTILRSMYDAVLQMLYVLHDEIERCDRAALYLNYGYIERHRAVSIVDKNGSEFAVSLSQSPMRASGEPELHSCLIQHGRRYLTRGGNDELSRLGDAYLHSPKAKYRDRWYPGNLKSLAEATGYLAEYELIQNIGSAAVHISALPLQRGALISPALAPFWAMFFVLRCTGAIADVLGISLGSEDQDVIDAARRSIFDPSDLLS